MGVLSISSLHAQSDFGKKQHRKANSIQLAEKTTSSISTLKKFKQASNYALPFTEYFDSGTFPPTDWTTFIGTNGVGNSYNWEQSGDGYENDGAWIDWDNSGTCEDWIVTPLIDLGINSTLSFYEKQDYGTDYASNYTIRVSTNTQNTHSDFTIIESYGESSFTTSYSVREIDLSAYDGQSIYIAFVMTNDDGDSWYIDNVLVEESSGGGTSGGDLIISEVADPTDNEEGRFVELYNSGDTDVDLTYYYLAFKKNSNKVDLSGTIGAGETFIFAHDRSEFNNTYGFDPDQWTNSNYSRIIGTKAIYLLYRENNTGPYVREDTYGALNTNGTGTEWDFIDSHAVRKVGITNHQSTFVASEWEIMTAYAEYRDVTPGNHNQTYYWDGSQNNEWDEYRNWTVGGGIAAIPDIGANVVIPTGTSNTPDLSAYQFPYFFNTLTINSGASFTLESDNILKVISDVVIESGATFSLESDANGAATLITEGSITGEAHIERYFATIGGTPDNGNWHYFSPPTSDMVSSVFTDQYLMVWDEPTTYWQYILNTDEVLIPGVGYGVLLDNTYGNTISMNGNLTTGDVISPNLNSTSGAGWQGWNLVGNPYTASVDWEVIAANLPAGIDQGIHYWDASSGQYVYYNNGSGTASQYIPPMQGFFIHITTDNQQFTFTQDSRTADGANVFYKSKDGKSYTSNKPAPRKHENRLIVSTSNNFGRNDKAFLEFHRKGTEDFDREYDATKFYSNNDTLVETCFSFNSIKYSINVLPTELLDGRYNLNIKYGLNDTYNLSFEGLETFDQDQSILLYDKVQHQYYDLREYTNIEFYNENNSPENRFEIVFDNYLGIADDGKPDNWLLFSRQGKLNITKTISSNKSLKYSYKITTLDGRLIESSNQEQNLIDKHFNIAQGIYIIKLISGDNEITKKVFLYK